MIRLLSLFAALLASSPVTPPNPAPPEINVQRICTATQAACEDECDFTFGTSHNLRRELGNCLNHCLERHDLCLLRYKAKSARE
jgi:hypothetical protein